MTHYTSQRYVDLCLFLNGFPVLVLENKVTAGYTENQLPTYGKWLTEKAKRMGGALVFLTYATLPPEDFLRPESGVYSVQLRSACSWLQVYDWFKQVRVADPMTAGLIAEFCSFMEAQNVSGMTNSDAEILQTLLSRGTFNRVNPLFIALRDQFKPQLKLRGHRFDRAVNAWAYGGGDTLWDWCYFQDTQWYISWGLTGKAKRLFNDPTREGLLTCFVRVGTDSGDIPIRDLSSEFWATVTSSGWTTSERGDQCWITIDAMTLFARPEGFMQAFTEWLKGPLEDANEILTKIYSQRANSSGGLGKSTTA